MTQYTKCIRLRKLEVLAKYSIRPHLSSKHHELKVYKPREEFLFLYFNVFVLLYVSVDK